MEGYDYRTMSDDECERVAMALKHLYRTQRYKTIAEVAQDILLRWGKSFLCRKDKTLIRIAYLASNSTMNPTKTDYRKMYRSVYNAIRTSDLFRPVVVTDRKPAGLRYELVTDKLPCKKTDCDKTCSACPITECPFFLQKQKKAEETFHKNTTE